MRQARTAVQLRCEETSQRASRKGRPGPRPCVLPARFVNQSGVVVCYVHRWPDTAWRRLTEKEMLP